MAEYVQLDLFDSKPYTSGKITPGIYMVAQAKKTEEIEGEQLELNLFLDNHGESYSNLKRAA